MKYVETYNHMFNCIVLPKMLHFFCLFPSEYKLSKSKDFYLVWFNAIASLPTTVPGTPQALNKYLTDE